MVQFLSYNVQDLYSELVERASGQGVTTQAEWNELVEALLSEHADWGEVDIDDDITSMREALQARWEDFDRSLQEGDISEG